MKGLCAPISFEKKKKKQPWKQPRVMIKPEKGHMNATEQTQLITNWGGKENILIVLRSLVNKHALGIIVASLAVIRIPFLLRILKKWFSSFDTFQPNYQKWLNQISCSEMLPLMFSPRPQKTITPNLLDCFLKLQILHSPFRGHYL